MDMIIVGEKCEKCKNCTLDESNKAKIMVYCGVHEKWYIYGSCIQCDDFVKIERN